MTINHSFEYFADSREVAEEFCGNDSEYQAKTLNIIGETFKAWTADKAKTMTHVQLLEIAEQLDDNGKWFISTLYEYMRGKAE